MNASKLRLLAVMVLIFVMSVASATITSVAEPDGSEPKQCWTLGQIVNTNGPADNQQGENGWYFLYSDQINLGKGAVFDTSQMKECTWSSKGSLQQKTEGGTYDAMWVPDNYLKEGLTGEAIGQPNGENTEGTFNNWVMTSDGTLNTSVETTAVTGFYAWEAPEAGEYQFNMLYDAGGNHCDLDGTRYYYVNDYYIQDQTPYKRTPEQREGGVAVSVNTKDTQLGYEECIAMTPEHDYLYSGALSGRVTLEKGERIYFTVDPRETGTYDMAKLMISVTTGEECIWADGDNAVEYSWDENNNCIASRKCLAHNGHYALTRVAGECLEVYKEPTCTEEGSGRFKAEFEDGDLETQYADRPMIATGHKFDAYGNYWTTGKTRFDWSDDNSICTWYSKCDKCGEFVFVDQVGTELRYEPGNYPTCTLDGSAYYYARFWWGWVSDVTDYFHVAPLGHDASAAVENAKADNADELTQFVWSDDLKSCTWKTKCSRCDEFIDVDTREAAVVYADGKEPTCTESGTIVHRDAVDFGDGITVPEITEPTEIPALGHDWSAWTEGEDGKYTRTCRRCNETEHPAAATPSVTLSKTAYVYNGKVQKPGVTVKANGVKLAPSEYKLTYSGGCKNVGKYTVTVALKNGLEGSKTVSYKIDPAATALKSVKAGKKSFTVKWTKKTAQTTGYQIQYSTNSKFKSAKTKTVTSYKKSSLKVKKLKSKKKYYVRIRTYKTVKGTKFYSKWSKAKTVKTR